MTESFSEGRKRNKRPTLRDVARLAGVSLATASRALNGTGGRRVREEVHDRVWAAAHQIGYPAHLASHQTGQDLDAGRRRTRSIGVILKAVYRFSDPFWAPILDGVTDELLQQHYHLRFAFVVEDLEVADRRRLVSPLFIDGLILLGDLTLLQATADIERPEHMVLVVGADQMHMWESELSVDVVTMEKRIAIDKLVDHLIKNGRRRLAFVGPALSQDQRGEAFTQALLRRDLPIDPSMYIEAPWSSEEVYDLLRQHFACDAAWPDALVCASDGIAIGALRAARTCGVQVPQQLAITGFDDIPFAGDLEPPLTTVNVPKALMGQLAARRLIERINHPDWPPIFICVPTRPVIRASSEGPPRNQL